MAVYTNSGSSTSGSAVQIVITLPTGKSVRDVRSVTTNNGIIKSWYVSGTNKIIANVDNGTYTTSGGGTTTHYDNVSCSVAANAVQGSATTYTDPTSIPTSETCPSTTTNNGTTCSFTTTVNNNGTTMQCQYSCPGTTTYNCTGLSCTGSSSNCSTTLTNGTVSGTQCTFSGTCSYVTSNPTVNTWSYNVTVSAWENVAHNYNVTVIGRNGRGITS